MPFPSFPSNNTTDPVAVYDSNFNRLFPQGKIIKIQVKQEAKVMEHPLETGETITDHAIIQPVSIDMDILIKGADYKNTYSIIDKLFHDFTLLTVQTNTNTYQNQLIQTMPHPESSEIFDGTVISLTLKEALFVDPQYGTVPVSPKNPKNNSTNDRGNQNPMPPTDDEGSAATHIFDWAAGKPKP